MAGIFAAWRSGDREIKVSVKLFPGFSAGRPHFDAANGIIPGRKRACR